MIGTATRTRNNLVMGFYASKHIDKVIRMGMTEHDIIQKLVGMSVRYTRMDFKQSEKFIIWFTPEQIDELYFLYALQANRNKPRFIDLLR